MLVDEMRLAGLTPCPLRSPCFQTSGRIDFTSYHIQVAHANGTLVALTAGDAGLAARKRDDLWGALHAGVDLLFTNRWVPLHCAPARWCCPTAEACVDSLKEHPRPPSSYPIVPPKGCSAGGSRELRVTWTFSTTITELQQVPGCCSTLAPFQVGGVGAGGKGVQRAGGGAGAGPARRHGRRHRRRRRLLHLCPRQPAGGLLLLHRHCTER